MKSQQVLKRKVYAIHAEISVIHYFHVYGEDKDLYLNNQYESIHIDMKVHV